MYRPGTDVGHNKDCLTHFSQITVIQMSSLVTMGIACLKATDAMMIMIVETIVMKKDVVYDMHVHNDVCMSAHLSVQDLQLQHNESSSSLAIIL